MSRRIANILGEPEHSVAKLIRLLEHKNGYPSHDARYLAENIQKIRGKLANLKLDPDDTTSEELYHALLAKFNRDSELLDYYFKIAGSDFDDRAEKSIELIKENIKVPEQWVIKPGAAKQILTRHPPKRVMKYLHYRSADSMLKRESLGEIMLGAQYLESASWHKAHDRLVAQLDQIDIEMRPLKLQIMSHVRWSKVSGPAHYIAANEELGVTAIWPDEDLNKAPLLTISVLLMDGLSAHQPIAIGRSMAEGAKILSWWSDMDNLVADLSAQPVSLSLKDNAINSLLAAPHDQRALEHGRRHFWSELVSRYENLPQTDGLFDNSIKYKIASLKFKIPEQAFEYVEDI